MALDFPDSPSVNDTFTSAGTTWRWNGSSWNIVPVTESFISVAGSQSLSNKTISGASNTLSDIPQSSVSNLTSDLASKLDVQAQQSNRNLLYNGAMQVAQRGTSASGITSNGYFTADRWRVDLLTCGTWTNSIETDTPTGSGFAKSLKMLCTTPDAAPSGTDRAWVQQRLEGQDLQRIAKGTASAQQVTVSFWVKSNVTGTYVVEFLDNDNSRQVSATYEVSSSATWEKKAITFPADTTGSLDNDNAFSAYLNFGLAVGTGFSSGTLNTTWDSLTSANRFVGQTNLAAATNNYWQITGVQLEVGPVATAFEHKSYGAELAECQRYFYRPVEGVANLGTAVYYNNTYLMVSIYMPVTMRANPTVTSASGSNYFRVWRNNGQDYVDDFGTFSVSPKMVVLSDTGETSGTAGQAGIAQGSATAAYVDLSAEL